MGVGKPTTISNNPQTWIKNPNPGICDSDSPMACLQRVGSEAMNKKINGDPQIYRKRKRRSQNPWIRESKEMAILWSKVHRRPLAFPELKRQKDPEGKLMGFLYAWIRRSPNAQIIQNKVPCLHKIRYNECILDLQCGPSALASRIWIIYRIRNECLLIYGVGVR